VPKRTVAGLALAALTATPAFAADLTLGARTDALYDDNVLGTEDNEVSDGEVLLSPLIGVAEHWGRVDAELNFKPTYEFFLDQKDLRGLNYATDGKIEWRPSARTSFELNDKFLRYRSLRLLASVPGGTPAEGGARDKFWRNIGQLVASHRLTPIDTIQLSGSVAIWEFDDEERFDQQSYVAGLNYQHEVSRALALGAGASYSRLRIQQRGVTPQRDTDYYNLSLIANYQPADTFRVRLSAGPTYVKQPTVETATTVPRGNLYRFSGNDILVGLVPSTCPTLPTGEFFLGSSCNLTGVDPVNQSFLYSLLVQRSIDLVPVVGVSTDDDDLTYFADASLEKQWEAASLTVGYRRDQGSSSAAGFSSISDLVEVRGVIRPLRELSITAAAAWENRKETQTGAQFVTTLDTVPGTPTQPAITNLVPVGLVAVTATQRIESLTAYVNAGYQMTPRARLEAAVTWRDQSATAASQFNDYERLTVMLGISVELDPIRW